MLGLPDVPDTSGSDLVNGQNLALSWQLTPKTGNYIQYIYSMYKTEPFLLQSKDEC
jgi:hypothetical protein